MLSPKCLLPCLPVFCFQLFCVDDGFQSLDFSLKAQLGIITLQIAKEAGNRSVRFLPLLGAYFYDDITQPLKFLTIKPHLLKLSGSVQRTRTCVKFSIKLLDFSFNGLLSSPSNVSLSCCLALISSTAFFCWAAKLSSLAFSSSPFSLSAALRKVSLSPLQSQQGPFEGHCRRAPCSSHILNGVHRSSSQSKVHSSVQHKFPQSASLFCFHCSAVQSQSMIITPSYNSYRPKGKGATPNSQVASPL